MREIKFRIWEIDIKQYIDYDMVGIYKNESGLEVCKDRNRIGYNFILEQYTGLKDKNGIEIYEGDIVQSEANYYNIHRIYKTIIEWNNDIENDSFGEPLTAGYCIIGHNYEIIGNIHETPELLK